MTSTMIGYCSRYYLMKRVTAFFWETRTQQNQGYSQICRKRMHTIHVEYSQMCGKRVHTIYVNTKSNQLNAFSYLLLGLEMLYNIKLICSFSYILFGKEMLYNIILICAFSYILFGQEMLYNIKLIRSGNNTVMHYRWHVSNVRQTWIAIKNDEKSTKAAAVPSCITDREKFRLKHTRLFMS